MLLLAGRYLELNRARLGLRSLRLSPEAEEMLSRYRWPGNVRELEHVISRAAIKAVSHGAHRNEIVTLGPGLLDLDDVAMPVPRPKRPPCRPAPPRPCGPRSTPASARRSGARWTHQGSWAGAARALDIDSSNLHKLARRLGLKD